MGSGKYWFQPFTFEGETAALRFHTARVSCGHYPNPSECPALPPEGGHLYRGDDSVSLGPQGDGSDVRGPKTLHRASAPRIQSLDQPDLPDK